jgi:dolichyl-phosphate beta-glucosyltransferase
MTTKSSSRLNLEFTIVLPCYNESHRLRLSLPDLFIWRKVFQSQNNCTVKIFLANDGCTDTTIDLAKELSTGETDFTIAGYEKNQGRGEVLKTVFSLVSPNSLFVLYMDADLATDLKHIQDVLNIYLSKSHKLVVCGNRYYPSSNLKRPLLRKIWSWGWRTFVCALFWKKLPDTQCGFKAFSQDLIEPVMKQLKIKGFVADVEIILRAWEAGAEVRSLDIHWVEKKGSTIRWSTVFKMIGELKTLKLNLRKWIAKSRTK